MSGLDFETTVTQELQRHVGKSTNLFKIFLYQINFWESNKIKAISYKCTPLPYVTQRLFQTECRIKHKLVNHLKTLSHFGTKITILAFRSKSNRSALAILPSTPFIENSNSDICSLEISHIVFCALVFPHLNAVFSFILLLRFQNTLLNSVSFADCVSIIVIILHSPNYFDLVI